MQKNQQQYIIPFVNQELSFWEQLSDAYKPYIKEVYFPLTHENLGTGRPRQPDNHLCKFIESGILPLSLLINPVVLQRQVQTLANPVIEQIEYYKTLNLPGITVANVELAKRIKSKFPEISLTASTLMEIYNEQQLAMLDDVFDILVPSNRALRDIRTLEKLRKGFNGKIRLLVNEACLPSCIYRTQHFYEMSKPEIAYPRSLCSDLLKQKPWLRLTGGWVLPQHLFLYEGLYDEIKLAGRVSLQDPARYFNVLDSYIHKKPLQPNAIGGGPASVNIPMDIDTEYYKYTLTCDKNCNSCSVCKEYWAENTKIYG